METEAITLREGHDVPRDARLAPYSPVGWLAYARDPDALARVASPQRARRARRQRAQPL